MSDKKAKQNPSAANDQTERNPQVGVDVHARTQTPGGVEMVIEAIRDLGENRGWIMKAILAVYVSTFLEKGSPVWLMVVGPPSSNKTTLTDLLKKNEDIFALDTMTSNPFISGQREKKGEKAYDLLPILDGKCFVIKEYGAFFSRGDDMVKQLLGDLTAIYDGEYSKHSPTRGTISYQSVFAHIGCVTPQALAKRQKYMDSVGARFLFLRVPRLSDEEREKCLEVYWDENHTRKTKAEITEIVAEFCEEIKMKIENGVNIIFDENTKKTLSQYANLIARARGIILTEKITFIGDDGKERAKYEVTDLQIEEPFRALKQIGKFAKSLAIVNGKERVEKDELYIVREIVLSSMQTRRSEILRVFDSGAVFTAKSAADKLNKNYKTVKRNLDELTALGIVKCTKDTYQQAYEYRLQDEFVSMFSDYEPVTMEYIEELFEELFGIFLIKIYVFFYYFLS